MSTLLDDIRRAYGARKFLHDTAELEAYRLFHGYSEGLPGLEIDRYGDTAIITSKGADAAHFVDVAKCLVGLGGFATVIAKERGKAAFALHGSLPSTELLSPPRALSPHVTTLPSFNFAANARPVE